MRRAASGSTVTAWSGLMSEASRVSSPFSATVTLEPDCPRMTGRPAAVLKPLELTPTWLSRVSPSETARRRSSSLPRRLVTPGDVSSADGAVTVTEGSDWACTEQIPLTPRAIQQRQNFWDMSMRAYGLGLVECPFCHCALAVRATAGPFRPTCGADMPIAPQTPMLDWLVTH